jgi:hypothetical protein
MNNPKIELKNVKYFQGHDGFGLNADVWVNGINCMHVFDGAYGGCFDYTYNTYNNPKTEQVKANIKLLNEYVESLPLEPHDVGKGIVHQFKPDLDMVINNILEAQEKIKEQKKKDKLEEQNIMFGVPDGNSYHCVKLKSPIATYLANDTLKRRLVLYMRDIKRKEFKKDYVFFNKNLQGVLDEVNASSLLKTV